MRKMGIETIHQSPRITVPNADHEIHPYLLRDVLIEKPNQVWSADIIYVPMARGFVYLVAVIDWFSRFVLSWRLSNTLEKRFCTESLEEALSDGAKPTICNTDQGNQFTSRGSISKILYGYTEGTWHCDQHGRSRSSVG